MKRLLLAIIISRHIIFRAILAAFLLCSAVSAQTPPTTSTSTITVKGVVLDAVGALVSKARVQIIDANGDTLAETLSLPDGTFEITSPVKEATLVVFAQGVGRFSKELNLKDSVIENIKVKLTMDCSADIKQAIPKKLDAQHFLVEIHYYGAFGDCPERAYRLWGTGEASVTYFGCGGKTFTNRRVMETTALTSALAELAKGHSKPLCNYYAGGIDAPRVEFTIFSGSEPRLVITHDEGANIDSLSELERQLERLIDPENRMRSLVEKQTKTRSKNSE